MDLTRPFSVVGPALEGEVLDAFFRVDRVLTSGEIHRLIGQHTLEGVRRCLVRMSRDGIVIRDRVGQTWAYQLNDEHIAVDALRRVARIRDELVDRLRREITAWPLAPDFAALARTAGPEIILGREQESDDEESWDARVIDLEERVARWTGSSPVVHEVFASHVRSEFDPLVRRWQLSSDVLIGSSDWLLGIPVTATPSSPRSSG